MRLNRQLLCHLAISVSVSVSCALFLRCERSDVISGAGGGVVSDMDPSLTDTRSGFALVNLNAGDVDSSFSLPAAADPAASTQAVGYALIGVNGDDDTLAAHTQYRVPSFKSTGSSPYGSEDSLVGAYLYFRAADNASGGASEPIAVYRGGTLVGLDPVDPRDREDLYAPGNGDTENPADNRIGAFTLGALSGEVDSMPLPYDQAKNIFEARVSPDTNAAATLAFSVLGYDGELRKIHNPYIVVHVEKEGKRVRDSISGFVRFTAFEYMGDGRAALPYSSQQTLRTAVFRVKLSKIVDTLRSLDLLADGSGELLNAVIAVKCNRDAAADDSGNGGSALASSADIGNYRVVVLDTLLTNEAPADSADAAALRSLRGQFSVVSSSVPDAPFTVHSIKAPLRGAIEKYNRGGTPVPYIYVYLRPAAENSTILWDKPPKAETVFTPSRSKQGKP